jgi:ParB-like chromosome segregation protein Spo0J
MVYGAHEEIVTISSQLQDMQQVMLYAGRVNDSPLADMALDVAIAIQGEPDDKEKTYAANIIKDLLKKDMARADKLLRRKQKLISAIDAQKDTIAKDISSIASLETKYELISKSLPKVAIVALAS